MQRMIGIGLVLALAAGCASAQSATSTAPASDPKQLSVDSQIDDVLDVLDARGKQLSDFTANVTMTDADTATGSDSALAGKIWMQRVSGDDARLRVVFDTRTVNDVKKPDKSEYTLDKGWLIDRNYPDHKEIRRQVLKPGQKMNLLKLGEGPFPLPLGQDKADVHRLFEVSKPAPKKDDPAGTIHVRLVPKPGTQFERKFKMIDFFVDPESRMPVRIETIDPNETTTRTTELKQIRVNSKLSDKDFELPKIDEKQWDIHEQPFEE